ncbi:DNA-binding protein [Bordetella genomosp. 8]|uniref:DNA-binding protein n=1 Tax=Bordetella genomosp. 8 TaxID=1416806 RepID=A0A1W6YEW1_9BORD|nr:ATP-binding protein [Bordetella genomosp. 8]ARP79559.1 DNA-binding protein [Bordetella genomosp. 8]
MAIATVRNEGEFLKLLHETIYPAIPIRSVEHLQGRGSELETLRRALLAPGRHAFVYGDRGVGKSSLAHTAAHMHQSSDAKPITVSGSTENTFTSLISTIAYQALHISRLEKVSTTRSGSFAWRGLTLGKVQQTSPVDIASQIATIGDAAGLLAEIGKLHSTAPVIVVDEFDTIASRDERNKFAALLKMMGDQEIQVKFIFTGIGQSLDDLLGSHQSSYRQLVAVELDRLGWDARRDIAMKAAHAFGLDLDENVAWRIAIVSDGYPYYVHLIMEKMLWEAFTADAVVHELGADHYLAGLTVATTEIAPELKRPYKKAVLSRPRDLELVVWSTADGDDQQNNIKYFYGSYQVICSKLSIAADLTQAKFADRLRQLREDSYGGILTNYDGRPGWYTYTDKMLRGYVRMQAEANRIELSGERPAPRQTAHVPTNARSGVRGPTVPFGIRFQRERNESEQD